ncbi:MAG: hypothetical protein M5R40_30080 [Anaerolineae bacterium]|nr:hypothetical protein [Anaerolineae bacterium]
MSDERGDFKARVGRELLGKVASNAFWSWESAVIIAVTLILTALNFQPFPEWQQWFWLVGGALAELALIGVALTDPEKRSQAVEQLFREKINPGEIKNARSRERLDKALEYRALMEQLIMAQEGAMRLNLRQAADEMDQGVQLMYTLGRRLDAFMDNQILKRDLQTVPRTIDAMQARLRSETDPRVREEIARTLDTRRSQLANLQQVENTMKRADIQIDNMLAAIGTLYAQMQLIDVKDLDSSRAKRLRQDVSNQVLEMQDTIEAIDEVYNQSAVL